MALRFMDGFDSYATADIAKKWTSVGNVPAIIAGTGRRGTAALRFQSSDYVGKTLDAQATWILGAAVWFSAFPGTNRNVFYLFDASSLQAEIRLNADGTLSMTSNGTTITGGTSSFALSLSTYYYLEWMVTIANSVAANTCTLRVNGVDRITLPAGSDLQQTANASANNFRMGPGAAITGLWYMDDVYCCDGTGSAPHNTFLGDCRVDTLFPNAEGSPQQWTPSAAAAHSTLVDEAAPNTTDYVSSSTPTQRELFGLQDLSVVTGTIYGVQLALAALKSDAGARSITGVVRSGASEAVGASVALSTSQLYTLQVQTTDPATSAAWTEAGVNSVQVGAEVA